MLSLFTQNRNKSSCTAFKLSLIAVALKTVTADYVQTSLNLDKTVYPKHSP